MPKGKASQGVYEGQEFQKRGVRTSPLTKILFCDLCAMLCLLCLVLARGAPVLTTELSSKASQSSSVTSVTSVRCFPFVWFSPVAPRFSLRSCLSTPEPTMSRRSKRPGAWLRPRSRARFSRCGRLFPATRLRPYPVSLFSPGRRGPRCREPSWRPALS
jgi:hypothetical protein